MKKKITIILLIILSFSIYYNRRLLEGTFRIISKQYKLSNKENFEVNIGETFEINLNQNCSTGYANCWLNENKVKIVTNIKTDYKPDSDDKNIIGDGGILTCTFKAIKKGCDTIKFANCPVLREQKNCNQYTNKEADEMFIVTVTE